MHDEADLSAIERACMADLGRQRLDELPLSDKEQRGTSFAPRKIDTKRIPIHVQKSLKTKWNIVIDDDESRQMEGLANEDARPWATKRSGAPPVRIGGGGPVKVLGVFSPSPGKAMPSAAPAKAMPSAPPVKAMPSAPPTKSMTSAAPAKAMTSAAPAKTMPSAEPAKAMPSAAPAKTMPSAAPAKTMPSAAPAKAMTSAPPGKAMPSAEPAKAMPSAAPAKTMPSAAPAKATPSAPPVREAASTLLANDAANVILHKGTCELQSATQGLPVNKVDFQMKINNNTKSGHLLLIHPGNDTKVHDVSTLEEPALDGDFCIVSTVDGSCSYRLRCGTSKSTRDFQVYLHALRITVTKKDGNKDQAPAPVTTQLAMTSSSPVAPAVKSSVQPEQIDERLGRLLGRLTPEFADTKLSADEVKQIQSSRFDTKSLIEVLEMFDKMRLARASGREKPETKVPSGAVVRDADVVPSQAPIRYTPSEMEALNRYADAKAKPRRDLSQTAFMNRPPAASLGISADECRDWLLGKSSNLMGAPETAVPRTSQPTKVAASAFAPAKLGWEALCASPVNVAASSAEPMDIGKLSNPSSSLHGAHEKDDEYLAPPPEVAPPATTTCAANVDPKPKGPRPGLKTSKWA